MSGGSFLDLMGATAGALALIDRFAENPKMRSYLNIDKSAFNKGAYVGYGHGSVYQIKKVGNIWRATKQSGDGPLFFNGASLGEISKKLDAETKMNPKTRKKSGDVYQALQALIHELGIGREYPDAEFAVSQKYNVSASKLRAAFDDLDNYSDRELAKRYGSNPRARKTARKAIKRVGVPAKKYASRPSQITRTTPSKRLKARRAAHLDAGTPAGFFPNPVGKWCYFGIKVNAGNDRNGNPRRAVAFFEHDGKNAKLLAVINEGYSGTTGAIRAAELDPDKTPVIGTFNVSVSEYRDLLKMQPGISY